MTVTEIEPTLGDPDLENEEPEVTHIIARGDDDTPAEVLILQATIEGTPLIALCGKVFIPSRAPDRLPLCKPCEKAMREIMNIRSM